MMDDIGQSGIIPYILLWLSIFLCYGVYIYVTGRKNKLPPGPLGLPLVGILPYLSDKPYLDFIEFGKKYGGIFGVYMGRSYVVVVTDVEVALQLLGKATASDRPPNMFHLMPDGVGFAGANGTEWSEQRRFTMMEMKNLGFGQSHWEKIVQMEVLEFLDLLEKSRGEPFDFEEPLSLGISNSVLSLVTSRKVPMGDPRRDLLENGIRSFQTIHKQTGLISYYPKLFKLLMDAGLLRIKDHFKDMIKMNEYIRHEIDEAKQDRGDHTFIEKYLDEIEKNKRLNKATSFNDTTLLGNVQALIIAGSHTTRIALQYLLLGMASYPEIQAKVHEEIDNVLGKDGSIDWVDRMKLPYCFATILEGQRWKTVAPLNLLHRTAEDISINGYIIPKGTDILTVLWAFHNDIRYWKDPDTFQPERFLSEDEKTVKEPEAFLPFSYGKRLCPGKTVALIEIFLYFVPIMQKFQILPASETSLPDLEGSLGLSLIPKQQPLRFVSR